MAKNKHQKLADLMQQMLNDIEKHTKDVRRALNLVQLHFYEKRLVYGRPRASNKVLKEMMGTYHMGLAFLSPKLEIRKVACEVSWIGMIIEPPLVQEPIHRQTNGWFIPWGVHIVCPAENDEPLAKDGLKALLYCPAAHEISEELDWFEEEDSADTFTHVVLTGLAFLSENKLLRQNLLKDPFPFYKAAEDAWEKLKMGSDAPDQPWKMGEIDFEPKAGQTLALAYEEVLRSVRKRAFSHRLRTLYKEKLEEAMFDGLSWSEERRKAFLQEWKRRFFGEASKPVKSKPVRWKQCEGVDRYIAAKFLKYFVDEFIKNPNDRQSGEIACILWLLIRVAQEDESGTITLQEVLNITSKDIALDDTLVKVGTVELDLSMGLHNLLACLCGKGTGERSRRLFENIDPMGKALERALKLASKELLGEEATSVSPTAFLVSPHLYSGQRISAAQRAAMRKARRLVPPLHTHRDLKKALREAREKA